MAERGGKAMDSYANTDFNKIQGASLFEGCSYHLRRFAAGRGSKNRTHDTRFWRPLLYLLSYTPKYRTVTKDLRSGICRNGSFSDLVEYRGLEPLTPTLPVLCAPNCANTPYEFSDIPKMISVQKNGFIPKGYWTG